MESQICSPIVFEKKQKQIRVKKAINKVKSEKKTHIAKAFKQISVTFIKT